MTSIIVVIAAVFLAWLTQKAFRLQVADLEKRIEALETQEENRRIP